MHFLKTELTDSVVLTAPAPLAAIIWLHGLGADGHDFVPIVPELQLPDTLPVRFVFPHARLHRLRAAGCDAFRAFRTSLEELA